VRLGPAIRAAIGRNPLLRDSCFSRARHTDATRVSYAERCGDRRRMVRHVGLLASSAAIVRILVGVAAATQLDNALINTRNVGTAASLPLRFLQLVDERPMASFLLDCSRRSRPWCGGGGDGSDGNGDSSSDGSPGSSFIARRRWTFARTHREVVAMSSALCVADAAAHSSRLMPSVRVVALFGRRSPFSYVALLAAWLAPCRALTVAPLSPWATATELRRLLALARPTTLALTTLSNAQADALRTLEQTAPEVLSSIAVVLELAPDIPADILPRC
jgi:hypothetical protein